MPCRSPMVACLKVRKIFQREDFEEKMIVCLVSIFSYMVKISLANRLKEFMEQEARSCSMDLTVSSQFLPYCA